MIDFFCNSTCWKTIKKGYTHIVCVENNKIKRIPVPVRIQVDEHKNSRAFYIDKNNHKCSLNVKFAEYLIDRWNRCGVY